MSIFTQKSIILTENSQKWWFSPESAKNTASWFVMDYEMPIVILMIDIIMRNKLTEVIVGPKSAISDHKLAKIEKMP